METKDCPSCNGRGKGPESEICVVCNGTGKTKAPKAEKKRGVFNRKAKEEV